METYTVTVLVRNQFGVLNRVTSMLRRRQLNLNTLTVSETESPEYSRITLQSHSPVLQNSQLLEQLRKLPDVQEIAPVEPADSVSCETLLVKMTDTARVRAAAEVYGAAPMHRASGTVIYSLTGNPRSLDQFLAEAEPGAVLEMCRTGAMSLHKETTDYAEVSA